MRKRSRVLIATTIVMSLMLAACSFAADHTERLRRYRVKEEAKVTVGMSTNQVKAKLGAPAAVEAGFPKTDDSQVVFFDEPKMVGQLNNSTWFYFSAAEVIRFADDILPETKYVINSMKTTKELYERYEGEKTLYILKGEIINPAMGQGYELTRNPDLRKQVIDRHPKITYIDVPRGPEGQPIGRSTTVYLPVLCVIFEKGTGVVAAARAYYRFLDIKSEMFEKTEASSPK